MIISLFRVDHVVYIGIAYTLCSNISQINQNIELRYNRRNWITTNVLLDMINIFRSIGASSESIFVLEGIRKSL